MSVNIADLKKITLVELRTLLVSVELFRHLITIGSAKYVCRNSAHSQTESSSTLVTSPGASLTTISGG
ncbi:hypothetical protein GGP41_004903 [Bipolaris sorokiniana]|uniref:Uncharacterized protein n=1 Tax=Cochliobolus sativus TaxID=45130 RepID=A0A8H5ZF08_COCSA|nr:hypothetical protein GGP41_004903 [Bipolaris sorokiniana]